MTLVGWLDCSAGASGDMLLGALVGAGVPVTVLQQAVDALGLPEPVRLAASTTTRAGLAANRVEVSASPSTAARTWADVRALLDRAADPALPAPVRALAHDVFARLARAEAGVHGVGVEDVHFHEVGALDALADVVGVAAGLHALGLTALHASPVALGSGTTRGAHGPLPVPAPAVLALLADAGVPVVGGLSPYESCTPTGAALLAAAVSAWGALPPMTVTEVGVGAGGRDPGEVANVVRLVVGRVADGPTTETLTTETLTVLETTVDDLDPRVWPLVLERVLAAGALDAWLTPVLMKKGRPGHVLSVLARPDAAPALRGLVLRETSSIGVREREVRRTALPRETVTVEVDGQPVRVKVARLDGEFVNVAPEWEDVAAAARALRRPAKQVLAAAQARLAHPDAHPGADTDHDPA